MTIPSPDDETPETLSPAERAGFRVGDDVFMPCIYPGCGRESTHCTGRWIVPERHLHVDYWCAEHAPPGTPTFEEEEMAGDDDCGESQDDPIAEGDLVRRKAGEITPATPEHLANLIEAMDGPIDTSDIPESIVGSAPPPAGEAARP